MLLGVHASVSGGLQNAFSEAEKLGINTFQIFTKNQRQWKEKLIEEDEGKAFKMLLETHHVKAAFSHATYLINLASADDGLRKNSISALANEVIRCHTLGLNFTVFHPGAAKGQTETEAIIKISNALKFIFDQTKTLDAKIMLENTAGQGSSIGRTFEQLSEIIDRVESPRLGICIDTCHAFAAGYDIRTKTGFETMMEKVDRFIGIEKIHAFHLNDSKGELASRIDRHDHIGKGKLGLEPFRQIINQFKDLPKVIETNKEDDMDVKNLEVLRSLEVL